MTDRYAQVALPLPVPEPYTYRIPPVLADRALPGARVVVPVRRQEWIGVITAVDVPPPAAAARDLLAVPDADVALPAPLLALAPRVARYYGAPVGMVLRSMLPAAMWGHSVVTVALLADARLRVGGTAERVVDWLARRGGTATVAALARGLRRPVWDVLDRLQRIGAVQLDVSSPTRRCPDGNGPRRRAAGAVADVDRA